MEGSSKFSVTGSSSRIVLDLQVPNAFQCGICRASPRNSVATSCGHMFCWPCLYPHFLQGQPQPCPVCCTLLRTETNIIPIYGNNEDGANSNSGNIPPRPNLPPVDVSAPFPSQNEVLEAFAIVKKVNERQRKEKTQAMAAFRDRYQTLVSVLRELRTQGVGLDGEEMSPEQRRRDKDLARGRMSAIYVAMEGNLAQLKEMWVLRRHLKKMQTTVTRVGGAPGGWWSD